MGMDMDMNEVKRVGRALAFAAVCPLQRMNIVRLSRRDHLHHDEHRRVLIS